MGSLHEGHLNLVRTRSPFVLSLHCLFYLLMSFLFGNLFPLRSLFRCFSLILKVRRARRECDVVAASIFVNPTQFAPNEDLDSYPRDLQRDSSLLEALGTDVIFAPR